MKFWQTAINIRKATQVSWLQLAVLCLFFSAFSFGQLGRVELGQASIYAHDVLLLTWLWLTRHSTWQKLKDLQTITSARKKLLFGAFLGWVLLGMSVAYWQTGNPVPFLYLARIGAYLVFSFSLFSREKIARLIVKSLQLSSGIYMVVFGLMFYWLLPDTRFLYLFGWDDHYYRLIGPLLDPNLSGLLYIIIGWLFWGFKSKVPAPLWLSGLLLTTTAIVLTYSRATYLALAVSALYYLWLKKYMLKLPMIIGAASVLFLIYYLAPKPGGEGIDLLRTSSIQARMSTTEQYLAQLQPHHWVIGTGFYTPLSITLEHSHAQVPDNILVTLFVQTGVGGTLIALLLVLSSLTLYSRQPLEIQAAVVAVLIHSQFNNSLLEPFIFLMLGITIVTNLQQRSTAHTRQ